MTDPEDAFHDAASCTVDVRLTMLGRTPLFRGATPAELRLVNERCRAVAVRAGEVVVRAGDPAEDLFVVATGLVKLLEHTSDGRQVLLDVCVPGESFGSAPALGDEAYPHDAQAAADGCLLSLSAATFERLLHDLPSVAIAALELTSRRLREAQRAVQTLSTLPVEAQVADTLLRLAGKLDPAGHAERIELPLTQADLAAMSGTTPESVNRVLGTLKRRGWVASGRGWFSLLDRAALASLARTR